MHCIICGNQTNGAICPRCGYDESQNREQYPTISDDGQSPRSNAALRSALYSSQASQTPAGGLPNQGGAPRQSAPQQSSAGRAAAQQAAAFQPAQPQQATAFPPAPQPQATPNAKKSKAVLWISAALLCLLAAVGLLIWSPWSASPESDPARTEKLQNTTKNSPKSSEENTEKPQDSTNAGVPSEPSEPTPTVEQGKVFNIYAWNEEFKGFFEAYYKVPEGVTVNWIINPSDNGVYQQKLAEALKNQANASADEKIDLFLVDPDSIRKYVDSEYTMDVSSFGYKNADTMYDYTVQAATDENGVCKGVAFECFPAAVIYRKSIARDVLGTDDPAEVQKAIDTWEKFDAVAAQAKEKGYYMTASFVETFNAFSCSCTAPWVDANNKLQFSPQITAWMAQAENYVSNGYTLTAGVWDAEKTNQMFRDGKTLCFFGPAWYYNYCMTNVLDKDKGCVGDWRIVQGPQPYFWGGTWLLAATGSDNTEMLKDVFETFTVNEDVCSKLVEKENVLLPNNSKVVEKYASDASYGNSFILDGQNDVAVFAALVKNVKWENHTKYDKLLNEALQSKLQEYFKGSVDKDTAMQNFYSFVKERCTDLIVPDSATLAEGKRVSLGTGSKYFYFDVTFSNGETTSYAIHTDADTVGEALAELNLIAGEKTDYGLYVKTVGGESLDFNTNGMFWSFYENGGYATSGSDTTPIINGSTYSYVATKA